MCRNIKPLFNFSPSASDEEINEAALQFVRKISGFRKPSKINEVAFDEAVCKIAQEIKLLLSSLKTDAPAKNRDEYTQKIIERSKNRFDK